ncbi:MAG: YdcH family protein [Paraglaciecola sp.]|uniref:YdcH family protein n=1 Tax=Paraglaciecola sp. TaxID=1920173 RepID=UPI0032981773
MLGENHSLKSDFPDFIEQIKSLTENDQNFATQTQEYDALDKEIRGLELQDSPIDDEAMHAKKLRRAALKDQLYQQLLKANS